MDTQSQSNKRTTRNLAIFTFLVITVGWFGLWLNVLMGSPSPQESLGMLIWLITPLVASLLLRAFAGDGWKDIGIRPAIKGNVVWYAFSMLVYPVCIAIILVIGFAIGAVSFPGFLSGKVGVFIQAVALATVTNFIKNIFEEFAWRGYLAPKVHTLGLNDFVAHMIVGIIWAVWHLPYWLGLLNISVLRSYTTQSLLTFIPLGFAGIIVAAIVYGELRMLTDSVWPVVLLHTIGNALILTLLLQDFIEIASSMEFLVTPGMEGVLSIVLFLVIGIGIHFIRRNRLNHIS